MLLEKLFGEQYFLKMLAQRRAKLMDGFSLGTFCESLGTSGLNCLIDGVFITEGIGGRLVVFS